MHNDHFVEMPLWITDDIWAAYAQRPSVDCRHDYAAMLLYEKLVTSATQIGEVTLSVEVDIVHG